MDWLDMLKTVTNLNSSESNIEKIIKCLIENAHEISKTEGPFIDGFMALASVEIFKRCSNVSIAELKDASTASEVILNYILQNIDRPPVAVKVEILRFMCDGENHAELLDDPTVVNLMHYDGKRYKEIVASGTKDEKKLERNLVNLSILDHLSTPIIHRKLEKVDATNFQKLLVKSNINYLHRHKAGEKLLHRFMAQFENIESYFNFFEKDISVESSSLIQNHLLPFINKLPQIESEINILWSLIKLPIFEINSQNVIHNLSRYCIGSLNCSIISGLVQLMFNSNSLHFVKPKDKVTLDTKTDNEIDTILNETAEKGLQICNMIIELYNKSVSHSTYSNLCTLVSFNLLKGISAMFVVHGITNLFELHDEDSLLKTISQKFQHGLVYSHINQIKTLLKTLTFVYTQTQIESMANMNKKLNGIEEFSVFENYLFEERLNFISKNNFVHTMLSIVATISYKKAFSARCKQADDIDPTCSESTTYFNDTYSCSDTESDESGSLLGLLFKETNTETDDLSKHNIVLMESKRKCNAKYLIKDEALEYINLSIEIYKFLQETTTMTLQFKEINELSHIQLSLLIFILKEIDKENIVPCKAITDTIYTECNNMLIHIDKLSQIVSAYIHNLLCNTVLNENMQHQLLLNLNISPWKSETGSWPLNISPRLLKILVQILSLKPQQEKEAACLSVWHKMIESIIDKLCSHQDEEEENDDLNIEHAQILLYLFYSLNLMQKKSILLLTASAVIRGSGICRMDLYSNKPSEWKVLLLSRLLMFFEYMMKHLYTPPPQLLEQVQSILLHDNIDKNLLVIDIKTDSVTNNNNDSLTSQTTPSYFYQKRRLYYLTKNESLDSDFKLDGLAWNFILCTPEKLKYQLLLDALVDVFGISNLCKEMTDITVLSVVQYIISICLKLLVGLPPSIAHIEEIMQGPSSNIYLLLWTMRCLSPAPQTRYLVVNSLVKQGLYTQVAEAMWTQLTNQLYETSFYIDAFNNSLKTCLQNFNPGEISLLKLLTIDCTSVYFYVNHNNLTKSTAEQSHSTLNEIFINLFSLFRELKDTLFKRNMVEFEFDLPQHIAEMLVSILLPTSVMNEHIHDFVKQLSGFIHQKDNKKTKEEKTVKICYDITFARSLPAESYIIKTLEFHLENIIATDNFHLCYTIQYTMKNILNIINIYLQQSNYIDTDFCQMLIPMLTDVRMDPLIGDLTNICKIIFQDTNENKLDKLVEKHFLTQTYLIFNEVCSEKLELSISTKNDILSVIIEFWCSLANEKSGKLLFYELFFGISGKTDFTDILFSFLNTKMNHKIIIKIIQLFVELLDSQNDVDPANAQVSTAVLKCLHKSTTVLKIWASNIIFGRKIWCFNNSHEDRCETDVLMPSTNPIDPVDFRRTVITIRNFFKSLIKANYFESTVASNMFSVFCQLGQYLIMPSRIVLPIFEYLELLSILHHENQIKIQTMLFEKLISWLQVTTFIVRNTDRNVAKLDDQLVENVYVLLNNTVVMLGNKPHFGNVTSSDDDIFNTNDVIDDVVNDDEEESTIEESDDENITTKLCTYLITQKDFMNQHWYYCYTCNMFDGIGVCTICAKVCHKNHDVSYAKYGNFFCDCGAKEDGTCIALTKKWSSAISPYNGRAPDKIKRTKEKKDDNTHWNANHLERNPINENLTLNLGLTEKQNFALLTTLTCLLTELESKLIDSCLVSSSLKCYFRAKSCLKELHTLEKTYDFSENLVIPALGSQEGAFENVRLNYTGEQGSIIRQLISTNSVRRVGLCCLSVPFGTKQHLVVAQDKGKIIILQLSTLLKQVDTGKQKLMITKLNSSNVPCSIIISLSPNSVCDDLIAICGIKECHVIQFSCVGSVKKHIVITPHLEAGNYIKRSIWLPSSLSLLALVTAETVQIYELSKDANKPEYSFLLPTGKIRDCSFAHVNDVFTMYVISSSGHIYVQALCEESLAKNGNYYITQILELQHPNLKDVNGQILGGGVSIYYSHLLEMLFCSFVSGRNFAFSLENEYTVKNIFNIQTTMTSKTFSKNSSLPLYNWTEVPRHPGLLFAMFQTSNNVAVLAITPKEFTVQELKIQNSKVKIMDFIAINHNISGTEKTSLIVLCEDGSLKLYNANLSKTSFWLSLEIKSRCVAWKNIRLKRNKRYSQKLVETNSTTIPVDFFEHYNILTDVEFGGNDLLQLYSPNQIKHRLNTNGLFLTSTKANGLTITVTNNDNTTIITGFRVLCGSQDPVKAPSYISVGSRTISTNMSTFPRWVDFALHRNEIISIQNENRLNIVFGNSQSPDNATMIDNIKIYGTTKETFGWPEEADEHNNVSMTSAYQNDLNPGVTSSYASEYDQYHVNPNTLALISAKMLEIYASFIQNQTRADVEGSKQDCLDFLSNVVLLPVPSYLDQQVNKVMSLLIGDQDEYLLLKERLVMNNVFKHLKDLRNIVDLNNVDPELFYLLVKSIHQITLHKPNGLGSICKLYGYDIVEVFFDVVSKLYSITPSHKNPMTLVQPGLIHVEFVFQVVIETILSYCIDDPVTIKQYESILFVLLTAYNSKIRYTVKQSITHFFKPKNIVIETAKNQNSSWNVNNYNVLKLQLIDILSNMLNMVYVNDVKNECLVPLMQTLLSLMLTMKLNDTYEKDLYIGVLKKLLAVAEIDTPKKQTTWPIEKYDLTLLSLKFLNLLMGKTKAIQMKSSDDIEPTTDGADQTAKYLIDANILQVCVNFLQSIFITASSNVKTDENLLRSMNMSEIQYLQPFFNKYDFKNQNYQVFQPSVYQLGESIIRLVYQIIKIVGKSFFVNAWLKEKGDELSNMLCDFMMDSDEQSIRRIIRKTLLLLCGSKEGYRNLKDKRCIQKYTKSLKKFIKDKPIQTNYNTTFDELVKITTDLKNCHDIAGVRPLNWVKSCMSDEEILQSLFTCSCTHNEEVLQSMIIKLINLALDNPQGKFANTSETSNDISINVECFDNLVSFLLSNVLEKFVTKFLINNCSTALKWQVHQVLYILYEKSNKEKKSTILKQFWDIYEFTSVRGKMSPHFIDLLGYFTFYSSMDSTTLSHYSNHVLKAINRFFKLLADHPSSHFYPYLHYVLDTDGYYFDREPCLDCNIIETQPTTLKLSAIKADARFSTCSMILKLIQSYSISKIFLRITDIKKSKMVRTINILYSNHNIQATVELKSKLETWRKAKCVKLQPGQTDVRIDFSLPITACNLMIEYVDFFETIVGCSETLQCPRCSAVVSSNPGICGNCGENVFQCHKCRAINYDEKDPFLCNSCGFSKFAKFDYTLIGKPSFLIDPIENDEERSKMVQILRNIIEKADRIYRQLQANKKIIELLLFRSSITNDKFSHETYANLSSNISTSGINKTIHIIAQKYCVESKALHDDLCTLLYKINAYRQSVLQYDKKQNYFESSGQTSYYQNCYRCILTSITESLKLFRLLTLHKSYNKNSIEVDVINSIVANLHRGTMNWQIETANLMAHIVRNDLTRTTKLCKILRRRITSIVLSCLPEYCIDVAIRGDLVLMEALSSYYDKCWEIKFKTTFELLLLSLSHKHAPALLITQSCLRVLLSYITCNEITGDFKTYDMGQELDFNDWCTDKAHFEDWKLKRPACRNTTYLQEKYFSIWKNGRKQWSTFYADWMISLVFNRYSTDIRQTWCSILAHLSKYQDKRLWCIDMSTNLLDKLGESNNNAIEFINYFKLLVLHSPWQQYLVLRGFLRKLTDLISIEINDMLVEEKLGFSLSRCSSYPLIQLVEILIVLWEDKNIREQNKRGLLKPVLEGYLNIRKMSLQRNLSTEYAQEKLLLILENITSGNEEDITHFMTVCIEILNCSPPDDVKTKVFAFERLCSLIHQDDGDVGEFFLSLEKDPQQEDFLQGRMLGNPYSSAESGLGPQMRDIKNKICRDCELVALLEDDNGMELLVSNKIINLDLLVKDIYKKIWLKNGGDRDTMKIVYRMRGLLGDATEEFVESIEDHSDENIDYEKKHRMANVVVDCGGLEVMLNCLKCQINLNAQRSLLEVVLKLFSLCSKVKRCQEALCRPEMRAMEVFLSILDQCIQNESSSSAVNLIESLLEIMNTILTKAASDSLDLFLRLSLTFGGAEYVRSLLNYASTRTSRLNTSQAQIHLAKVLAALVYGNDIKMAHLCSYFEDVLDFDKFEKHHQPQDEQKLELFCVMANSIEPNIVGNILKDYIMNLGIINKSIEYILSAPSIKLTLFKSDCPDLKHFISRPALKYVLRILTGLSVEHEPTQRAIAAESIPIIHMLEQVSSDEHVGTLAENLLETLSSNPDISTKVAEVRNLTKAEKKRMAMATREKQLHSLGMKTNEKGQVTVNVNPIEDIEKLKEETGLYCFICREGYMYQPTKVLGIYTYSKRVILEEFEIKPRKQIGYSTVTHFNIIHIDCHISAIRLARGRDEWESASLQNTNTKCNGILPLWGPEVPEISFATCVNRQQNYIRDATQCNDISFQSSIHDLKLLLEKFAFERSFHVDSGGGGPQSNLNIVPYLLFHAIYILLSSHSALNEQKKLNEYIACKERRLKLLSAYLVEGPFYYLTSTLALKGTTSWKENRVEHLKRLLIIAQTRHFYPTMECDNLLVDQCVEQKYEVYKPYLMIWSLVELIYSYFTNISQTTDDDWPVTVFNFIRYHDEHLLKTSEQILRDFTGDYVACTSFTEFCDVANLFEEINDPTTFISNVLSQL